jgi:chloramphenicol-sensitive protein RarD
MFNSCTFEGMATGKSLHYAAALSAFCIWGTFSLALKPLKEVPSMDILFWRVFVAVVVLWAYLIAFRRSLLRMGLARWEAATRSERLRAVRLTLLGGFLLTCNWLVFMQTVNHVSVKSAAYAYLVCPVLTSLMAVFVLQETLSRAQWVALGIALLSCLVLALFAFRDLLFSMIVAVSYAGFLISQRHNTLLPRPLLLAFQLLTSAFVLLPLFPFLAGPLPAHSSFPWLITVVAVVFTILPLLLNLFALNALPSGTMGMLLYVNPLINFALAVLWFHEPMAAFQWLAYALVLISVVVYHLTQLRKAVSNYN